MEKNTKEETGKAGPDAAERLRAMFSSWEREETGNDDDPSWGKVKQALNEGRPDDGKPFPGE